jgi:hypothetical protein
VADPPAPLGINVLQLPFPFAGAYRSTAFVFVNSIPQSIPPKTIMVFVAEKSKSCDFLGFGVPVDNSIISNRLRAAF